MDLIKELNKEALQKEVTNVQVGDTVRVHVKVKEGSRERIQVFEGTVIAKKHGGIEETITVRRISYGVGVEKVFPVHSPSIDHIEVVRNGKRSPGQAVLSARPRGQGRQGQGEAVSSSSMDRKERRMPLFLLFHRGKIRCRRIVGAGTALLLL